ncbi:MAG: substrate-binding domain-containing protein, partial [Pseudomonadota bacterium]
MHNVKRRAKMKSIRFGLLGALLATMAQGANAGEVNAAVAANFTAPMQQIAALFEKESGNTVKLSFGSSG